MGIFMSRSSSNRSRDKKTKSTKKKGKRFQQMETSAEDDNFVVRNNNEKRNSTEDVLNTYNEWNHRIDQQQIQNVNDPPGAPSTYSPNYPVVQNDMMNQPWSSTHDPNDSFYQGNLYPATTASNIPYDPNQYVRNQIPNTFLNQPQQVLSDERTSKKVQFAHVLKHQQQAPSKNPLTSTQSWHEQSATHNDNSIPTTIQETALTRQPAHRSAVAMPNTSTSQVSVEKPIYVGIDHKATLAERGQTAANVRHHRSNDKNHSNGLNSHTKTHRPRSNTHHQHKNQESNDLSTSKVNIQPNRSMEPLQIKLSGPQRPLTTTSTSTIIPNKQIQFIEQPTSIDNDMKPAKTRGSRHQSLQHPEQQASLSNELKPSRSRGNHQQQRQQQHHQQQRVPIASNHSPSNFETSGRPRRTENKHQSSPVMRTPISQQQQQQQRQKQSSMPLAMTSTASITRTRV